MEGIPPSFPSEDYQLLLQPDLIEQVKKEYGCEGGDLVNWLWETFYDRLNAVWLMLIDSDVIRRAEEVYHKLIRKKVSTPEIAQLQATSRTLTANSSQNAYFPKWNTYDQTKLLPNRSSVESG